jgi:uncharacterized membrane protein SpoIIM required for sporulation
MSMVLQEATALCRNHNIGKGISRFTRFRAEFACSVRTFRAATMAILITRLPALDASAIPRHKIDKVISRFTRFRGEFAYVFRTFRGATMAILITRLPALDASAIPRHKIDKVISRFTRFARDTGCSPEEGVVLGGSHISTCEDEEERKQLEEVHCLIGV